MSRNRDPRHHRRPRIAFWHTRTGELVAEHHVPPPGVKIVGSTRYNTNRTSEPPTTPEVSPQVAHLTTLHVIAAETELRDRLTARATQPTPGATPRVDAPGLDADQTRAASAIGSTAALVVVEGAAGAGKTTMLGCRDPRRRERRAEHPCGDAGEEGRRLAAVELSVQTDSDRVRAGLVDDSRTTDGTDGLPIGRGDLIQTRRNDSELGVANRQTWIVQRIGDDGSLWARDAATERKQQRTVHLPAEYVAEHAHLAYAATAYGVQGMTAPESHTVFSDALDAAGVYVGLTRGREANRLHVVVADLGDAKEQFTAALERDRADRGLHEATEGAQLAVAGIVTEGPVREVNAERARLTERIGDAEKRAAWWSKAAARLDRQADEQRAARDEQQAKLTAAQEHAEAVQAKTVAPLVEHATEDAAALMAALDRASEADTALRSASRLRRRSTARTQKAAEQEARRVEADVRERWGSTPVTPQRVPSWVRTVAERNAEDDPRLIDARNQAEQVQHETSELTGQQMTERQQLRRAIYRDPHSRTSAKRRAEHYAQRAEQDRQVLAQIEALPPERAAALIRERAEAERLAEATLAGRAARLATPERDPHRPTSQRAGAGSRDQPVVGFREPARQGHRPRGGDAGRRRLARNVLPRTGDTRRGIGTSPC